MSDERCAICDGPAILAIDGEYGRPEWRCEEHAPSEWRAAFALARANDGHVGCIVCGKPAKIAEYSDGVLVWLCRNHADKHAMAELDLLGHH